MIRAIAITGPTASGKTKIAIELAERLGAEIISADSMQIYRGMDIGTAKPTEAERTRVPHHLFDFLAPSEAYSAERYRKDATRVAKEIAERGKLPMFVGGTGLYIATLMRAESAEVPKSDPEYRDGILSRIKGESDIHALWERLREIDPESAEAIHENNVRRVIRAIEIFEKTGLKKSELDARSKEGAPDIDIEILTLDFHNRENLYKRIDQRVDAMMEAGLLSEALGLYSRGELSDGSTAAQAIGYKELLSYIKGESSLEDAVLQLKTSTRRYAKRQLTWFRRERAHRIMMDSEDGVLRKSESVIGEALEIIKKTIGKEE